MAYSAWNIVSLSQRLKLLQLVKPHLYTLAPSAYIGFGPICVPDLAPFVV